MKKRILVSLLICTIGISSAFSAMNFMPLESSSKDGTNQVIGSLFYLGTINSDISASSIGLAAFYQNKLNENMGIYANGGAGKALSFKFRGSTNYSNTVAVFIQSGPYYMIPLADNMLVKVGAGIDITLLGGKDKVSSDEDIVIAFGAGVFGDFEYDLIENVTLVGSLNLGFDFISWMTDASNDLTRSTSGTIINIMPAVGVSYTF